MKKSKSAAPAGITVPLLASGAAPRVALLALATAAFGPSACSREGAARVDLDLRVALPSLPEGQGLSLQDGSTTAPVALLLRVKGEDGAWQERTLEPGRSSASFEVLPGKVDVEARYVAGRVATSAGVPSPGASMAENVAALRAKGCAEPAAVEYFLSRGERSQEVSESSRTVSLSLGAVQALPLVPAGATLKRRTASGLAAAGGVRLAPLDPAWGEPLPAACPGSHIGQATADATGVASLRLPVFPGAGGAAVVLRYFAADGSPAGRASLPAPSASSLRANLHRVVLDGAGVGLALVDRSGDPVKEFGAGFFADLVGGLDAAKICVGATVLGVSGAADCKGATTSAPTPDPAPAPSVASVVCTSDGQLDCLTTPDYPALKKAALDPGDIREGRTLAGVTGTLTLPPASSVLSGATYGPSSAPLSGGVATCSSLARTGCYSSVGWTAVETASLAAGDIRAGASIGGVAGAYSAPLPPDCTADGQTNCNAVAPYRAAATLGLSSKVLAGQTVAGVSGTVPAPRPPCSADGQIDCTVPPSGPIKAADTTHFKEWDLRKKRGAGGAALTFAGMVGQLKSCRNRAASTLFNLTTAPGIPGIDAHDTIDDYANGLGGLPPDIVPWMIPGVTPNQGQDFACGGIFATGSSNGGSSAAGIAFDPNGNWQDLTPGVVPGGSSSSVVSNGCNATDKHCVFREAITGLMVSEVNATALTWSQALNYCATLGDSPPIPVIDGTGLSEWRVPTAKELASLAANGLYGLNVNTTLSSKFGAFGTDPVWTATTVSTATTDAWGVKIYNGMQLNYAKTNSAKTICVH